MINFRPANSCCFCINLKAGTLTIAWLTVIGCGLNILTLLRELAHLSDVDIAVLDVNPECDAACLQTAHKTALGLYIFSLVMDAVLIGISVLLIIGVNKDRPRFMTPYIAYMIGGTVFLCLLFITGVVLLASVPLAALIFSLIMFVFLAISLHFLHVVLTYQRQIRQTLGEAPIHLEEEISSPYITKDS